MYWSGYYDVFPPKNMNVSVKPIPGDAKGRKMLVAEKDFEPGDIVYKVNGSNSSRAPSY